MQVIDTLIEARWIVPVEPVGTVLQDHALAILDGRIVGLVPQAEAAEKFLAAETLQLRHHVLIPGFVNLHTHAAMTLLRGVSDDLPLMTWLTEQIWPRESRWVSEDFVYDGTLLACAEMLKGGTTTFCDMYFFPDAAARAAQDAQMRAAIGAVVIEFPTAYAADADDYLAKGLAVRDRWRNNALLHFTLAPHAPYTVSDNTFERIAVYAEQLNLPITLHVHETLNELQQSEEKYGKRPLARLHALGLLGAGFIGVHAVHLLDHEIRLLAQHGCHVAHCPSSNLKLASGLPRIHDLLGAGVNLGLGTDGAASNNRLDMMAEMRLAALLAKAQSMQAEALPASQALELATLGGARALGLDHLIGSLRPGKAADLTAVDLSAVELQPVFDPISHLVYACGREHVSDVWVAGRRVLEQRVLTTLDTRQLISTAQSWRDRLSH